MMGAMVPFAVKGTQSTAGVASKALTGDIYTRKRTRIVGRGKKAHVVEDELRVNPVGIGVGIAAVGAGVLTLGAAMWLSQMRLKPTSEQEMVTVIDSPGRAGTDGYWSTGNWHYEDTGTGVNLGRGYSAGAVKIVRDPDTWVPPVPYEAAITHQVPTGKMVKRFSIEERRGTSFGDIVDALNPVGPGQRFWGNWGRGKVFGPWLGRK